MKKSLKIAMAAGLLVTPAVAEVPVFTQNMENPLFIPTSGTVYAKASGGIMYKVADDSLAMQKKGVNGTEEFPIWRAHGELGVGITDRLTARASVGWTQDDDIARKGMHHGRLGLNYRIFDGTYTNDWVWDVYADAHLGGLSKMTGKLDAGQNFFYDNYTNGRWGFYAGTTVGKTWGKFTGALFAELHQTFGNSNNEIDVTAVKAAGAAGIAGYESLVPLCAANPSASPMCGALLQGAGIAGLSDELSVNLKPTTEWAAGLKTAYELTDTWTLGGSFTFRNRAANGIESVATVQNNALSTAVANALAAQMADMQDGINEYVFGLSVANQITDCTQVAMYGEYTMDDSEAMSQNGTDVKAEVGVRLNVLF